MNYEGKRNSNWYIRFNFFAVWWFGWARMALEHRWGIILERGLGKASVNFGNESEHWGSIRNPRLPTRKQPKPTAIAARFSGQGSKQARTSHAMQVDVAPSRAFPYKFLVRNRHHPPEFRQEIDEIGSQKEGKPRSCGRRLQRWAEMLALRHRQDSAVANRTHGTQNSVQCLRGQVQVGATRTWISTRSEPDICVDKALELAPKSVGAPKAEGDGKVPAPASAAAVPSSSEHGFRRTQRWRLLDPPAPGPRFQAPDIEWWGPED